MTASHRVDKFSKNDVIVSPSILSANFSKLGEQVRPEPPTPPRTALTHARDSWRCHNAARRKFRLPATLPHTPPQLPARRLKLPAAT